MSQRPSARSAGHLTAAVAQESDGIFHPLRIDLVDIDRLPDSGEHGQRQTPAQMLPKFLQTINQLWVFQKRIEER
jgi:hypothetical protein